MCNHMLSIYNGQYGHDGSHWWPPVLHCSCLKNPKKNPNKKSHMPKISSQKRLGTKELAERWGITNAKGGYRGGGEVVAKAWGAL